MAPLLSWTVDHDSNRTLIDDPHSSQGAFLNFQGLFKRATGTSTYSLTPQVGWQQYTNNVAQNSNNQSLQAAGTWIVGHSIFSGQALYSRDNTLNHEFLDSGNPTGSSLRKSKTAAFSWNYDQSSRDQLAVQLSYSDIRYENEQFFSFFGEQFPYVQLYGYKYPSLAVTETHQWSSRTSLEFGSYASRLISESGLADSNSYGAHIGVHRDLTSRINLFFSLGLSRESRDNTVDNGYIGRFELTRTDVMGAWRLYAERSVSASGYGYLVTRNEAGLSFSRRLTPRWTTSFSVRGVRNDDVAGGFSGERHNYSRADTELAWQATRTWHISAGTAMTRTQLIQNADTQQGWSVWTSATWTPQPGLLSR